MAVLDLDTGKKGPLIEGGSNPAYLDTGHLVFARGDTLMAVPFEASELAVRGEPVALVQGIRRPAGGATDYALSASGTLVYVPGSTEEQSLRALVWVDRTGQVLSRAIPELVANPRDPRISPDGQAATAADGTETATAGDLWSSRPAWPAADSARAAGRHCASRSGARTAGRSRSPRFGGGQVMHDRSRWQRASAAAVARSMSLGERRSGRQPAT